MIDNLERQICEFYIFHGLGDLYSDTFQICDDIISARNFLAFSLHNSKTHAPF